MTGLQKLIQRIEDNKWRDKDSEHPLARLILEELARKEKFHGLFDEIRDLSDEIIKDFLILDLETKIAVVARYISLRKVFSTKLNEFAYNSIKKEAIDILNQNIT